MKLEVAQAKLLAKQPSKEVMELLEKAGRLCYRSSSTGKPGKFIKGIVKAGHESVIEHIQVSANIVCSRSISHQIVRHRLASYSQESQRYCNYSKNKFDNEVRFIIPTWLEEEAFELREYLVYGSSPYLSIPAQIWVESLLKAEKDYKELIEAGWKAEQAREVLPNSTKTELYMSMNLRQWRHFLKLRTGAGADPQIRNIANMLLRDFKCYLPVLFEDIKEG